VLRFPARTQSPKTLGASLFDRTADDKRADKISPRTNGTFGFCRHTIQSSKKQKSHFLLTHGRTNRIKKVTLYNKK
jgi:hypothetical protein